MPRNTQLDNITRVQKHAKTILEELQEIKNKDKADHIQRQATEKALRDLKKAGAHVGYANANRHTDDAIDRLKGVAATNPAVTVTVEELEEAE